MVSKVDDVDWSLLLELQQNARTSYSELGRRVGLTAPAVAERVRRLEETGSSRATGWTWTCSAWATR